MLLMVSALYASTAPTWPRAAVLVMLAMITANEEFSLIRPPNHLAVYGGLGVFPKKSG
jgi:hypothetical protein